MLSCKGWIRSSRLMSISLAVLPHLICCCLASTNFSARSVKASPIHPIRSKPVALNWWVQWARNCKPLAIPAASCQALTATLSADDLQEIQYNGTQRGVPAGTSFDHSGEPLRWPHFVETERVQRRISTQARHMARVMIVGSSCYKRQRGNLKPL